MSTFFHTLIVKLTEYPNGQDVDRITLSSRKACLAAAEKYSGPGYIKAWA